MSSASKVARLEVDDDVFAADETKVHTLSKQAIAEMLETAERQVPISSAPPPPLSGVRIVDSEGGLEVSSAARSGEVPALWRDDDEGLEPTRLSDRAPLARPVLVTQLLEAPPVIVCPPTPTPTPTPRPPALVLIAPAPPSVAHVGRDPEIDVALERRARLVAFVAFLLTVVPGLVAVYYFTTMR